MRGRVGIGASLIAAAAVGALAASSLAGPDEGAGAPVLRASDLRQVTAEPVTGGASSAAVPMRGGGRPAQALSHVQTQPITIESKTEEGVEVSRCPKGSKAVTGYFETGSPGTFLDLSRPIPDAPPQVGDRRLQRHPGPRPRDLRHRLPEQRQVAAGPHPGSKRPAAFAAGRRDARGVSGRQPLSVPR